MEDSEQRKKRLKEMRLQADRAQDSGGEGSSTPSVLANPLAEDSSTVLSADTAPRFNYYTDPMNAFSDKRIPVHVRPEHLPPPPPLPLNFVPEFSSQHSAATNPQMSPSPTQALPTPYRNPVWNGPRGPPQYNFPLRPSGGGTYPSPRFESPGSPSYNFAPGMNQWPNHNPNISSEYIPIPASEYSPNQSPAFRNNPNSSRGRGRGFWHNNRSHVSGRGSGQGSSSHGRWSNEDSGCGPERFYKRSMVEDPWKFLKPIIWYSTISSSNTSYARENSKSTSTKREGPPAVFSKSNSGPSLAEYLASAFNEASNTEENV